MSAAPPGVLSGDVEANSSEPPAQQPGHAGGEPPEKSPYEPFGEYLQVSVAALIGYSPINVLLVFTPVAFFAKIIGASSAWVFLFALLALIPLAALLGFTTEELANYTSQTLGGLLNATFGNATEVIISAIALAGAKPPEFMLLRIVQVSLLGSILSNCLLVLGCAFLLGGIKFTVQRFNRPAAVTNCAMLLLSTMTLLFPDVMENTHDISECRMLGMSRMVSVIMLLVYGAYLFFQLKTHTFLFEDEEEEEEEGVLGFWGAMGWMAVLTLFISVLSEYLVDAIDGAATDWGVPELFIGVIIIPIVGNAAEHATAVVAAWHNKMELSLGVAVGSSVQVSTFVIPFMVLVGWGANVPLGLDFHVFETTVCVMTVLIVNFVIHDGESNWLQGLMLLVVYVLVAIAFIEHKSEASSGHHPVFCWSEGD
eukprot:COSAG05_NODE_2413_length_3094_cov_4.279800_1_plen_425_part_00